MKTNLLSLAALLVIIQQYEKAVETGIKDCR